jgi:2,3-diketo-5-methylthiopentyl-1-phosphate enolase
MNFHALPFGRSEALKHSCLIATYLVSGVSYENILQKAGNFVVGQTVGTWIAVPGISPEMVDKYQGQVLDIESAGLSPNGEQQFLLRAAFPMDNFGGSFAMLLTSLVGNDVSTALKTRLVHVEFSHITNVSAIWRGPQKTYADIKNLARVSEDRPLVLNMIKPCLGFSPEEGAKLFYESALGGVDLIKDDELLASPAYNTVYERTKAYLRAAEAAYEKTGKRTVYFPNISGTPSQLIKNAELVIEAGARACLVNYVFGGLDALAEFTEAFGDKIFIMGHYAGIAAMSADTTGIADNVFIGTLPRLAGVHSIMTPFPGKSDFRAAYEFHRSIQAQTLPMGGMPKTLPAVGGGVTPVNQAYIQELVGHEAIIGIGGAIQGHPMGTTAGAEAAMTAVKASARGLALHEAAKTCASLRKALELWS